MAISCLTKAVRLAAGLVFILLAGTGLSACRAQPSAPLSTKAVEVLDEGLRHYLNGARAPTPALPAHQGTPSIRSCRDLLAALQAGTDLSAPRESLEFAAYSDCLAGAVAEGGRGAADSRFNLHQAGQQILTHLDLASVRSSLAPRRPGPHYFLTDFNFKSVQVQPHSVTLASDAFLYRFMVLAAGDFRHTGAGELLVRFTDQATGGSYDSTAIFILGWRPDADTIEATDAVDYLRSSSR